MSAILRVVVTAVTLCALTLSAGAFGKFRRDATPLLSSEAVAGDPIKSTSNFFSLRADRRRCASPLCGGLFVKRVNLSATRCADGKSMPECYVAEIDWNGHPQVETAQALLRGEIVNKKFPRFGRLGVLRVTESWQAASDHQPAGLFYRVRDRGLRCIAAPCPTHHEAKLNTSVSRNIAGVDLTGAQADEATVSKAFAAMTGQDGILMAGEHARVTGPAGGSESLKSSQFYLRTRSEQASAPCRKTGCSKQICSDRDVMSTCEWREEYACYQTATCERQRDGKCGFTKTPELTACLAKK